MKKINNDDDNYYHIILNFQNKIPEEQKVILNNEKALKF